MTPNELIETIQRYVKEYPEMANSPITITTERKRRVKGDFYKRYHMTSWGFNSLIGKGFNIGIKPENRP